MTNSQFQVLVSDRLIERTASYAVTGILRARLIEVRQRKLEEGHGWHPPEFSVAAFCLSTDTLADEVSAETAIINYSAAMEAAAAKFAEWKDSQ